jgi:hypothetical protein
MAARTIGDDDADYSCLIKQCSSQINCCSARVWFAAIRPTAETAAIRPPDATLSRLCGDARPCNAWGIAETICGPDDMIVSRSVPLDVPADGAAAADWPTRRWRWWSAAV